jgi:hypothetical protein
MNTRIPFIFVIFASATLTAFAQPGEGISPSRHPVSIVAPVKPGPTVKSRWKMFDRAAVQKKMNADPRYAELVKSARGSVAALVANSDDELRALIPPANTKRALMVHRKGCPVHSGGVAVYQPFGTTVDLSLPLQVKCPIGGEVYPNRDFPDDGQGWLDNRPDSPTKGERYYFVGWFTEWFLNSLPSHIKTLGQLWFLTGEEVYAKKAQVLLRRFMEVYPDIDGRDLTYDGTDWGVYIKMTATMWEGGALMNITRGVELLLPTLSDDFVRDFRAKVMRPAFDAYRAKPAPSNWGSVWNLPFAKFADVTGDRGFLDYLLWEHPVAVAPTIDNQFFRDGIPYEAAFSYGSHYLYDARDISRGLGPNGKWVWEHPHLRESFPAYANLVCLDRFTHFFGDTGGLKNTGLTIAPDLLEDAWTVYRTPVIARYLLQSYEVNGRSSSVTLDDLFSERTKVDLDQVKRAAAQAPPLASTLAPVRGFAVMRAGRGDDRTELFFDFGYAHAAHSHADRLNINIFAAGREFVPEMGYPEYMDSIAPSPGGWTTHTVSHATVEVNEKRQLEGVFGDLHVFVEADGLRYVDASCEDAYVHCGVTLYRRSLALIDIPGGAYTVDIFRVRGGRQHDFHFHSLPSEVKLHGPALSAPRKGTLAGETVEFGVKPEGVFPYQVDNSGYQYLYDVQTCEMSRPYTARWTAEDGVSFSAVFIPDRSETFMLTKGYPRPSSKSLPPMQFLVRRKLPGGPDDISTFASVLSVEKTNPVIIEAARVELASSSDLSAYAVRVKHAFGEDLILSTTSPSGRAVTADGRYELIGQLGVASWRNGRLERMTLVDGTTFAAEGKRVELAAPEAKATVKRVFDDRLVLDRALPAWTAGRVLFAVRKPVETSYRVASLKGTEVSITPGTWIGRGRADRYDARKGTIYDSRDIFPLGEKRNRLADITGMKYPEGNRNYYAGAWLVSEDGSARYRLTSGGFPGFVLDPSQSLSRVLRDFPKGKTFLLYDLGPGDTVRVLNWKQTVY